MQRVGDTNETSKCRLLLVRMYVDKGCFDGTSVFLNFGTYVIGLVYPNVIILSFFTHMGPIKIHSGSFHFIFRHSCDKKRPYILKV